jgi:AcrR family transcriptional regulator
MILHLHTDRSVCNIMDNTKDFIIEEAFKLFLNHSYEAVSISDISNAIGFTKGALYHHFKNKEELFKSVVDKFMVLPVINVDLDKITLLEFIQESNNNSERFFRNLFSAGDSYASINYLAFFADTFRHYPGFSDETSRLINKEMEKSRVVIENAIESGEIRSDVDPEIIATYFLSFDFGLAGNLVRQQAFNEAIELLRKETIEFYKLLKKS